MWTFNPILVWFYQSNFSSTFSSPTTFQSHFGLILSPYQQRAVEQALAAFQSHFGLILSLICDIFEYDDVTSFNPILVWFYRLLRISGKNQEISLSIPFWSDFIQPNQRTAGAVTLTLSIPFWSDFINIHFNQVSRKYCELSIPFWSDFIFLKRMEKYLDWKSFQSHFGLILSRCSW